MRYVRLHRLFPVAFLLLFGVLPSEAVEALTNLIPDGDCERFAAADRPPAWAQGRFSYVRDGGQGFLRLEGKGKLDFRVALADTLASVRFSAKLRTSNVVSGPETWQDARIAVEFVGADGKRTGPWPNVPHAKGSTDWLEFSEEYRVPPGAVAVKISPANFGVSGTVDFDDLTLLPGKQRESLADLPAPEGFAPDPQLKRAWRSASETQETICLNSLWQFLPATTNSVAIPAPGSGWGWFKVPGLWPTKESYGVPPMEQDALLPEAVAESVDRYDITAAWYKRTVRIPDEWLERSMALEFTMLQSYAKVFVDGKPCGELLFPGGRVDLGDAVQAGREHEIAILVKALPLAKDRTVFMAPDRAFAESGTLTLRGITGDLYLTSESRGWSLRDVRVETSLREKSITFNLAADAVTSMELTVEAEAAIGSEKTVFGARKVSEADRKDGRLRVTFPWADAKLWDTHTPQNQYRATVTLRGAGGTLLARSLPVPFAFREFRIEGRDFILNDKRIHLRALVLDNLGFGAGQANYDACRRTLEKLKAHGFNFFITHNYNFAPGKAGYMDGLFQAADDVGVLAAFSMPHIRDFDLKLNDPEQEQLYRQLADWLASRACNHPSVVTYAMNHNACGYKGDQNPLRIDGTYSIDDPAGPTAVRAQALQAAAIVKSIDPTRPVYHHQSGNLGDLYTINIYLNWAPVQERSDWLEHWQQEGVKPVFFVEWGLPHIASWSTYRGPHFIWRTPAIQQIWDAEYAAAEKGDAAYRTTPDVLRSLKDQQNLWAVGEPFTWSRVIGPLRSREHNYLDIQALFLADNWRSHRARGISAMLPWDQDGFWNRAAGSRDAELANPEPYAKLEHPGIVPDTTRATSRYLYALPTAQFEPTVLGKALLRWNMPLCAFIAGREGDFSEKRHNYAPGEMVRKQLLVINDSRETVECNYAWTLEKTLLMGAGRVGVEAGDVRGAALECALPGDLLPGSYTLRAKVSTPDGSVQDDSFTLNVLPVPAPPTDAAGVVLYDPRNESAAALGAYSARRIEAINEAAGSRVLIIGRNALKDNRPLDGLADLVRGGLRVIVLEQDESVLADRLGFRVNIHGLRTVFVNDSGHPVFAGLGNEALRDWAGSATLTPPYLEGADRSDPSWFWCGFENTRVWRGGNRGTVASVLPEKPERGDFRVLAKGGFDLQFAPLLEYREGQGMVILCQMEVSGRTEDDPAAKRLLDNAVKHALGATVPEVRKVYCAGDDAALTLLSKCGVASVRYAGEPLGNGDLLVVCGPLDVQIDAMSLLARGANIVALGLDKEDSVRLAGSLFAFEDAVQIPSYVERFDHAALRGIGNEEVYWRGELPFAAIAPGAGVGNEALRALTVKEGGTLVMSQAAPWTFVNANAAYFRKSQRRNAYLVGQLLRNLGASQESGFLANLENPARASQVALPPTWKGKADPDDQGRVVKWFETTVDTTAWAELKVPGVFDGGQVPGLTEEYNGLFWYKLRFAVPSGVAGEGMSLFLGAIDDESWVWLNGKFLGEVTRETNPKDHYSVARNYRLAAGDLRPGQSNDLTVLVNDTFKMGGIWGTPKLSSPGKWLDSYYTTEPVADDDPYRYYRW
jgi:hypothetical protein